MTGPGKYLERMLGLWVSPDIGRKCIEQEPAGRTLGVTEAEGEGERICEERNRLWWLAVDLCNEIDRLGGDAYEFMQDRLGRGG